MKKSRTKPSILRTDVLGSHHKSSCLTIASHNLRLFLENNGEFSDTQSKGFVFCNRSLLLTHFLSLFLFHSVFLH